jgi:hypothetical protein
MTGSSPYACQQTIVCSICTSAISLETCNTDEHGSPVHEECYVRKLISSFRAGRAVQVPKNWLTSMGVLFHLRLRVPENC